MKSNSIGKHSLLASLYISQYIPMMFVLNSLPVFLREEGVSLEQIGLLSMVALPVALKFLWSPVIDRFGYTRWGHYRFWIFTLQFLLGCTTLLGIFLDIQKDWLYLVLLSLVWCVLSTTQDIAADALAIEILPPSERGIGNAMQKGGNYLGAVIGSGGMLILLDRVGWSNTVLAMAAIIFIALIPLLIYKDLEKPIVNPKVKSKIDPTKKSVITSYFNIFLDFYRRPQMGRWLIILLLYMFGASLAWGMMRPLLVDLGLSKTEIGLMVGVVSFSSGIFGAIAAGFLVKPLGRKKSLLFTGIFMAFTLLLWLLPTFGYKQSVILYLISILAQIGMSAVETVLAAIMMDKSSLANAGTDFTVQTSVMYFSGIFAMGISGKVAEVFSYGGLFLISTIITLIAVVVAAKLYDENSSHLEHLSNREKIKP